MIPPLPRKRARAEKNNSAESKTNSLLCRAWPRQQEINSVNETGQWKFYEWTDNKCPREICLLSAEDLVKPSWEKHSIYGNSTAYQSQGEGDQPSLRGTEHSAPGTKTSLKEILGKRESLRRVAAYSNTSEKHIQLLVVRLMYRPPACLVFQHIYFIFLLLLLTSDTSCFNFASGDGTGRKCRHSQKIIWPLRGWKGFSHFWKQRIFSPPSTPKKASRM